MFDLNSLRDFIAVIQEGSFAGAGRALGVPKSTLSKRIQVLEKDLGIRLIERTTRALRMTSDGAFFYERALGLMREVEDTRNLLQARTISPSGVLRISAPLLFGQTLLGSLAAQYREQYPDVTLDLVLTDRRVDLIEENFDASIRTGQQPSSSLVVRVFAEINNIVVASPKASRRWAVALPDDLARAPCLTHQTDNVARSKWQLVRQETVVTVQVKPVIQTTSMLALRDAAIAGAGVAYLPEFLVEDALKSRRLERLLPDWSSRKVPVCIVYPSARLMSNRLRTFIDHVATRFEDRKLGATTASRKARVRGRRS
jgi:DNA-binding transcriptional LysR family regulator